MLLTRLLLAAVGGLALTAAYEPFAWAPLAIPGVALFALATKDLRVRSAGLAGLVFGLAFYLPHIYWMRPSTGTDAWLALSGIEAAFYGLIGLAAPMVRRLWGWPVWLAALWAGAELLRSTWPFSGMPWGRVSFAAIDTPVAAAAAYVGLTLLSFLLVLVAFLLAAVVETWWRPAQGTGRPPPRLRRPALVAALVVVLGALLLPALRPYDVAATGNATVAVVQGNVPGRGDDILLDHYGVTRNHARATEQLADDVAAGRRPQPDFVLWPENTTAVDPFADAQVNDDIRDAVEAIGTPVIVGGLVDDGEAHVLNQGIVWDPETGPGDRYTKQHPVAYGEYIPYRKYWSPSFGDLALIVRDMKSGTRSDPLRVGELEVADAICFDVAYDDVMREQVRAGADLLAVQSSNANFIFTDQIDQQFAITRLRAIETGRALVVATPNGISGVIAPDGTVVSTADPRSSEVLVEQVALSDTLTPAMRLGRWPAWSMTFVSIAGLLLGAIAYRRSRLQDPSSRRDAAPAEPQPDNAPAPPSEASVG